MHALPVEGLTGRLVVDSLVQYLNFPGAAIVIVSMVVIALYLSTTFSFNTAQQWMAIHFAFALAWRDRIRNWRSAWVKARGAKEGIEERSHARQRTGQGAKDGTKSRGKRRVPASRARSRRRARAQIPAGSLCRRRSGRGHV